MSIGKPVASSRDFTFFAILSFSLTPGDQRTRALSSFALVSGRKIIFFFYCTMYIFIHSLGPPTVSRLALPFQHASNYPVFLIPSPSVLAGRQTLSTRHSGHWSENFRRRRSNNDIVTFFSPPNICTPGNKTSFSIR